MDSTAMDNSYLGIAVIAYLVVFAAIYVYTALALGAIFRKAGVEPWKAWIPFYNSWLFLELGALPGWIILLALVPYAGAIVVAVFTYIAMYRIGVAFGKGGGLLVLGIFLPLVWYGVVGWSRWVYRPDIRVSRGGRPPFIGHGSYPGWASWPPPGQPYRTPGAPAAYTDPGLYAQPNNYDNQQGGYPQANAQPLTPMTPGQRRPPAPPYVPYQPPADDPREGN